MDINIEKYVTEEEIHEAIVDEIKYCVREKLTQPGELDKLIVNAAYSVGREELNKIIPSYKEKLEDRIKLYLTDSHAIDFEIFYRGPYNNDLSVAKDILDKAVKENEFWIARDWSGLIIFRKKPIYSKIAKVFYAGSYYVCKLPQHLLLQK